MEKRDYSLDDLFDNVPSHIKEREVEDNFLEKRAVKIHNDTYVKDNIYECAKCKNKGRIAYLDEYGKFAIKVCDCHNIRVNRKKMEQLGLLEFLDENSSFDEMIDKEQWQKTMINSAKEYVDNFENEWLFVCGSVGSGKTKLCSIVFSKLLEKNPDAVCNYLRWDSENRRLTFPSEKEKEEVFKEIEDYKTCDILYIDDFLRLKNKNDFNTYMSDTAKSIIDYRYTNKLPTIISSELYYNELEEIDEAIATRIYQRCKKGKYVISIKRDKTRNMRKNIDLI